MTTEKISSAITAVKQGKFTAAQKFIDQHELHARSVMKGKAASGSVSEYYKVYGAYLDEAKKSVKFKRTRLATGYLENLKIIFGKLAPMVQ
ncbi:MAG: hypothetical protein HY438_03645 [DPANN group archaeon]|nr:hypothetical protein [DPANN group archaeon]